MSENDFGDDIFGETPRVSEEELGMDFLDDRFSQPQRGGDLISRMIAPYWVAIIGGDEVALAGER